MRAPNPGPSEKKICAVASTHTCNATAHTLGFTQVKSFISETPVGIHERTSMKEHLVRHGSKHKIQVHTTKRNKQQQKQKQNHTHFQNINNEKPEKRSLTKTKARGKKEEKKIDGCSKHTHSLTHIHRHALAHPR